jgi:multidrug efflux system membrane fusion protein
VWYPVQRYYEYNGYLDAMEMVRIMARVKGFLNEVHFTEGDEVKKGDLLFKIDPREYEAAVKKGEADRLKAISELNKARSEATRATRTAAVRAMSEEELQQRIAARDTAEAVLKQTEAALEAARLELSFTEIFAPIAGRISRTLFTPGNLVGHGEAMLLTTIVSVDPIYVYFDVPEHDFVEYERELRKKPLSTDDGRAIEVGVATENGFPHRGEIDFQENRADISTGTIRMRGKIPNPRLPPGNVRLLYPGLYARVRTPAADPQPLLTLPEDALMTGQEGRYVYVLGTDDVVQKRTVSVGPFVWKASSPADWDQSHWSLVPSSPASSERDAQRVPIQAVVAIANGLQPEDRVVINGLTKARPGASVTPQEWTIESPSPARDTQ